MKSLYTIIILSMLCTITRAQSTTVSRLISYGRDGYYNTGLVHSDSVRYYTSGNHICDLKLGYQNDSSHLFYYYPDSGYYKFATRYINTLDTASGFTSSLQLNCLQGSGTFENAYTHHYAYLPGNGVMDTLLRWNINTNSWEYMQLCADTFLANHMLRVHYNYSWDNAGMDWQLQNKTVHTYTTACNPDSIIYLNWQATSASWQPSTLMKYVYDSANRQTSRTYLSWDVATNNWSNIQLILTQYSSAGDTSIDLYHSWHSVPGTWQQDFRRIQAYDSTGNLLSYIQQYFSISTQSYLNYERIRYTYNSHNQPLLMVRDIWNPLSAAWEFSVNSSVTRYHYEEYNTGSLSLSNPIIPIQFHLYPNPANDFIWLDWQATQPTPVTILLTDIQGRSLFTIHTVANELPQPISTQALVPGIYFLKFVVNGRVSQKTFQVYH